MAKDLPFFKFKVSEWSDGDITLEEYEVQGVFINICSYYWSREGNVSLVQVHKKFSDSPPGAIKTLIDSQIIKLDQDQKVVINFLDEQLTEVKQKSQKAVDAAEARWKKHRSNQGNASAMQTHSGRNADGMPLRGEEIREDKKRKEKKVTAKACTPPSFDEVVEFFQDNGFSKRLAKKAFDYYEQIRTDGNHRTWRDGAGKPVKSWKAKVRAVWFKEEKDPQDRSGDAMQERILNDIKNVSDEI